MSFNKKSAIATVLFLGVSMVYYWKFLYQKDIAIFPHGIEYYTTYADKDKGGKSEVLKFEPTQSYIDVVFNIENKAGAYAGFNLYLNDSIFKNFSAYNSFKISFECENIQSISFSPRTFEKGISNNSDLETYRLNYHVIDVQTPKKSVYYLGFDDFKIREWWLNLNSNTLKLNEVPNWNTTKFISFTPELKIDKNKPVRLKVYSIHVAKNNQLFFLLIAGIVALYWLILLFFKLPKKQKQIIITHKNLEINDEIENTSWQEKVEFFIGKDFTNPDLQLNDVAHFVGKPSYVISKYLKDKFNLSFKEYLNKIRLEEAKKLLIHSSLSIKEISYKVGFATTNHFTRVFREELGMPPSEFRINSPLQ